MKYTFVVVAHQTDYEALCLQARSLAKYLPRDLVAEIIIIGNPLTHNSHRHLIRQYGRLAKLVKIIDAEQVVPFEKMGLHCSGWFSQQILKLMVCQIAKSTRYVVLDAKNFLVYPLSEDYLQYRGKPKTFFVDFSNHTSKRWLFNTLHYFNLPDSYISKFVPTITPFVLPTYRVKQLVTYIEQREDKPFAEVFLKNQFTEFFLFAGYLIHTDHLWYNFSGTQCYAIWDVEKLRTDDYVKYAIGRTEKSHLPFFSVHRASIPHLSSVAKNDITAFWKRRGLDGSTLFK